MKEIKAFSSQEQQYSVDLGTKVVSEIKLELVCDDGQLDDAIDIISRKGRTGQKTAGWIYVTDVEQAIKIDGS